MNNFIIFKVPSDWVVKESDETILSSNCPAQFVETKPDNIVVWVDPLDGTSEYTQVDFFLLLFYFY